MNPEHVIEAFELYNEMVRSLAAQYRLPLADVRSVVGPEEQNWGDATHFSPPGSKLAALEVSQAILKHLEK